MQYYHYLCQLKFRYYRTTYSIRLFDWISLRVALMNLKLHHFVSYSGKTVKAKPNAGEVHRLNLGNKLFALFHWFDSLSFPWNASLNFTTHYSISLHSTLLQLHLSDATTSLHSTLLYFIYHTPLLNSTSFVPLHYTLFTTPLHPLLHFSVSILLYYSTLLSHSTTPL